MRYEATSEQVIDPLIDPLIDPSVGPFAEAVRRLDQSFSALPQFIPEVPGEGTAGPVLLEAAARLADNFPYFHPLYAGQMLKPPHPVAQAAYALAMRINPNNHALDGGRASSAMEKEAVAQLGAMFGWTAPLGHLTGGGTMANLEALWVAGQLHSGKTILASTQAHYTHRRISGVLRLPFDEVPVDEVGRMEIGSLEERLHKGDVGCVVATCGTTSVGAVDDLAEIVRLREKFGFRIHVDAAYGGYFTLADNTGRHARAAFDQIRAADSVVIDPHKHGLQPYGCGCVLFRDTSAGALYRHDSPYTYFSSSEMHLGEISLECSRPGAAAVALWATQRLLPLVPGGEFAQGLSACRRAAIDLARRLRSDPRFVLPFEPELDIVVWAPRARSASAASSASQWIFDQSAQQQLHLALTRLPVSFFAAAWPQLDKDQGEILCLRSVLMKPAQEVWIDEIVRRLSAALG